MTARQAAILELAADHEHVLGEEDQRVVHYILDQALEGGTPMYHKDGERPERDPADLTVLINNALIDRLRPVVPTEALAAVTYGWRGE